jgi:RHS repeat-associated protein
MKIGAESMKTLKMIIVGAILCMSLVFVMGSPAGMLDMSENAHNDSGFLSEVRHFALKDAVTSPEENYGYTEPSEYKPLEIHASSDASFDYMAVSPYYKVFFKGTKVRMTLGEAWVEFELAEQELGEIGNTESIHEASSLSVRNVFSSVDLSYNVDTSLLTETLTLRESKPLDRLLQKISWDSMTPRYEEDGSLVFFRGDKKVLRILPPFMKDANDAVCTGMHYELVETETGYELHKVIEESGQEWLKKAVYPVVIDPSMQILIDAWTSSGLTPFGQYFQSLTEYVNPANGHLTITQADLSIPGRGLDLVISRVYETPALFYELTPYMGQNPYNYEEPPVNVGKGWQLDFPYVGQQYLHLWGGTLYKISWVNNTFENHEGAHFTLVKNGDNTYTLTTAGGIVYVFSTAGKVTSITDLDQNTITFSYTNGVLTSITDTIGRTVTLSYSGGRLWKISYNGNELEYSYDTNGCLLWMEDFLNRRTSYYYNTGYNYWLLSKIEYVTTGYTTYTYDRFSDSGYYRYYVTHQRVYESDQVRHITYSYIGSLEEITGSTVVVKNESDVNKGYYECTIDNNMITQRVTKNASGTPIRKVTFTYNSRNEVTEQGISNDGTNLSYTTYYGYDNWGNAIYFKDAEGYEKFFSYANTSTSGFFMDNAGSIIRIFSNAFSSSTVPSSVHTALIGAAEEQDSTYVKEVYVTYGSEAHPTQGESAFGTATTWLTFSGTFNEKTGQTSFPIDLSGHSVAGNGVLQITGLPSDDNYQESHSHSCEGQCGAGCKSVSGSWQGGSFQLNYKCCKYELGEVVCALDKTTYIGSFAHYPGTLGYQSYSTTPGMNQMFTTFLVKTFWKAYPAEVQYNLDQSTWKTVTSNLTNGKGQVTVPITDGEHTLYLSESSSYQTKFSWDLYVPVDNALDTYSTSITCDTYGNVITVTDAESNSINLSYSSTYSGAYLTEMSTTIGQDTITKKATYDYYRGWITSVQDPEGVEAGSGYDTLFTYDDVGRVIKKEFPLLQGQSQRSCMQFVYDCENRTITVIDPLGHYAVKESDKLGRVTHVKAYTGTYSSGSLYATLSYTYRYDDLLATATDFGNHTTTYTYDFLGRSTYIQFADSSSVSLIYDDTNNKVTFTNARGFDRIYWFDWLSRLTKVEEEYGTDQFTQTTYQYDEIGNVISFTDAENHTTSYAYGSIFGVTRTTYPDSSFEEYFYDSVGNLASFIDCNGKETEYTYDSLYRITEVEYEDQSTLSFTYDLNSNRIQMVDNSPDPGDYVEYSYDYWNRVTSETRHIFEDNYTVSYQYDTANRLVTLTYPDDMEILYSYDDLNRLTDIKRYVDGSNDETLMDGIEYNMESAVTQLDYGNGLRAFFSYDSLHRPLSIELKDGETSYLDLDYTYDNNSNITQLVNGWRDTDTNWNSDTESYSYDGLNRLTSASCTAWSHSYSYDKAGNITAKDGITYTINTINQVTSLSDSTAFVYDSNGNRIEKTEGSDTWDYTYDCANRLTRVEKNDTLIGEYVYDGNSRRIQVTENNITTTYIYSGLNVLYEENTTGKAAYIYGPTGRMAKRTTIQGESNTFYYHTDHLGSTRLVTDASKAIIEDIRYHPFGEPVATDEESHLYTGKERDSTGLYYYEARYYDPDLGRFLTRDPLTGMGTSPQSLNRYTYCINNPVNFVDLTGLHYKGGKMCDENGNCYHETENGWMVILANGNVITSQQIEEALENAKKEKDQARRDYHMLCAIVLVLQALGYDVTIEENLDRRGGGSSIVFDLHGSEVTITVLFEENPEEDKRGDISPYGGLGQPILITIYYNDSLNMTANELIHTVGHEMQHAEHYSTGLYESWIKDYGREGANALSESEAYRWNVMMLPIISFPGAVEMYSNLWLKWTMDFYNNHYRG